MDKFILVILLFLLSSSNDKEGIYGKWDLVEYEAIDAIRNSDGYLLGDFNTQNLADIMFNLVLDSMYYDFRKDTLYYIDIDTNNTIRRRAFWSFNEDTLYVKEIDRIYFRKYFVKKLSKDSLVFNAIFDDGMVSKHSYKFVKVEK
jgi:hypothetical protein